MNYRVDYEYLELHAVKTGYIVFDADSSDEACYWASLVFSCMKCFKVLSVSEYDEG